MNRTISIKLLASLDHQEKLLRLREIFNKACNFIVPFAIENKCWNRIKLHHLSYFKTREATGLGSQMTCNAIQAVACAYKVLKIKRDEELPKIEFKPSSSVHIHKRDYKLQEKHINLSTMSGRIDVPIQLGDFQKEYLIKGELREGELLCRKGQWYFNVVVKMADVDPVKKPMKILGVDLGENNAAATSSGRLFGGSQLNFERDKALNLRSRLQSKGTRSAKQLLKKISGNENRHVTHVNHELSKEIVKEAVKTDCTIIAMENLTNIRKRMKGNKRLRARLHRWSWHQLQTFIEYKAHEAGLKVMYINPAYTSQTCATCGELGKRKKSLLECLKCGARRNSDINGALNICKFATEDEI